MTAPARSVAVAPAQPKNSIMDLFMSDRAQSFIAPFLPEGADPRRVAATVLLAVRMDKTGVLRKCTPESLVLGVARVQQWGLELGTTAHLLPFGNKMEVRDDATGNLVERKVYEATPVADYKGLAELMVRSGAVRHVEAHAVYEADEFKYRFGLNPQIDHVPALPRKEGARITHAYVILHLPFGRFAFEVMGAEEIDEIRKKHSKQWKDGPLQGWYAKKTVVRQIAKTVPKNPRMAAENAKLGEALAVMEDEQRLEFGATGQAKAIEAGPAEDEIVMPGARSGDRPLDEDDEMALDDARFAD